MERYTVIGFLDDDEAPWMYSVHSAGSPDEAITVAIQCMCQEQGNDPEDYIVVEVIRGVHRGVGELAMIKSGTNFADAEDDGEEDCDEDEDDTPEYPAQTIRQLAEKAAHAENRVGNPGVDY